MFLGWTVTIASKTRLLSTLPDTFVVITPGATDHVHLLPVTIRLAILSAHRIIAPVQITRAVVQILPQSLLLETRDVTPVLAGSFYLAQTVEVEEHLCWIVAGRNVASIRIRVEGGVFAYRRVYAVCVPSSLEVVFEEFLYLDLEESVEFWDGWFSMTVVKCVLWEDHSSHNYVRLAEFLLCDVGFAGQDVDEKQAENLNQHS